MKWDVNNKRLFVVYLVIFGRPKIEMSSNFADMEFVTLAKDGTEGYYPELGDHDTYLLSFYYSQ